MKEQIAKQLVIFISLLKWVSLSSLVGLVSGALVAVFVLSLYYVTIFIHNIDFYYLFLPLALFLSGFLIHRFCPESKGHGTEKVIEAFHQRDGIIDILVVPFKLITSVLTIAFGGSAGKEGPSVQMGAGIASYLARLLGLNSFDRRKLVICGISGGFAAGLGTPLSGAFFGMEVLFVGKLVYKVILPSIVASITAFKISNALGISIIRFPLDVFIYGIEWSHMTWVIGAGIWFGIVSILFTETFRWAQKLSERIRIYAPAKGLLGGGLLIILALLFSDMYLGLGMETIKHVLGGNEIVWYAFLVKILFTVITLSFCGSGGLVLPMLFIGATSGALYAQVFDLSIIQYSALGMVSMLAGCANTPITACILSIELFGSGLGSYAAVCCIISFIITGYRTVYPTQILAMNKSESIYAEEGQELEHIESSIIHREGAISKRFLKFLKLWEFRSNKKDSDPE